MSNVLIGIARWMLLITIHAPPTVPESDDIIPDASTHARSLSTSAPDRRRSGVVRQQAVRRARLDSRWHLGASHHYQPRGRTFVSILPTACPLQPNNTSRFVHNRETYPAYILHHQRPIWGLFSPFRCWLCLAWDPYVLHDRCAWLMGLETDGFTGYRIRSKLLRSGDLFSSL
jgi:hypothetical protein